MHPTLPPPPPPPPAEAGPVSVHLIGAELLEYRCGADSCLLNVGFEPALRARAVYASEAQSPWFPHLVAHLQPLLATLPGRWRLV
jgi:hypothetical protein